MNIYEKKVIFNNNNAQTSVDKINKSMRKQLMKNKFVTIVKRKYPESNLSSFLAHHQEKKHNLFLFLSLLINITPLKLGLGWFYSSHSTPSII